MEEYKSAKIEINLDEGSVSISGSEDFVEKNMSLVFSFVEESRSKVPRAEKVEGKKQEEGDKQCDNVNLKETDSAKNRDRYKEMGIYNADAEGEISIQRKVPGKTKAEKMKNIALIVLFEKEAPIEGASLKPLCEKQGCWDGSNAAQIFGREIRLFIKKKQSPQKWTIDLTVEGKEVARSLLESMANDKR